MKNLIIVLVLVAFTSCSNKEVENKESLIISDAKSEMNEMPTIEKNEDFSNPVLIFGSSFGNYFQTLYKLGKYDKMLIFTSSKSIEKFGKEEILSFYRKMDFAYTIKLKSKTEDVGIIVLNYEAGIMATKHMLRMSVVVENDTCKILLDNIKKLR